MSNYIGSPNLYISMLKKTIVTPKDYVLKNSQVSKRKYHTQKYVRSKSSGENILAVTVSESYILNDLWKMCAAQNRVKYMSSGKWNHYMETLYIQWHRNILAANSTPLFIAPEVRSPVQSKCASSLLSAARTSHFPYGCGNGFHKASPLLVPWPSQGCLSSTNVGGRNAFCQASSKEGKVSCSRTVSFNFAFISKSQDLFKGCPVTHFAVQLIWPYLNLLWKGNAFLFLKCLGKHREIQNTNTKTSF